MKRVYLVIFFLVAVLVATALAQQNQEPSTTETDSRPSEGSTQQRDQERRYVRPAPSDAQSAPEGAPDDESTRPRPGLRARSQETGLRNSNDPFAALGEQARAVGVEMTTVMDSFESDVRAADPCEPDVNDLIGHAKSVCFKSVGLRAQYYKAHLNREQEKLNSDGRLAADHASMRQQVEAQLSTSTRQLTSYDRRVGDLRASAETEGRSADRAVRQLQELQRNKAEEVRMLRQAQDLWAETEGYLRESRQKTQARINLLRELVLLLNAESLLHESYFTAVEQRTRLACSDAEQDSFTTFKGLAPTERH
jgi:hypothetical protein